MWVRVPVKTPVPLNKALNHCFVLWMGRKADGPVCCVKGVDLIIQM